MKKVIYVCDACGKEMSAGKDVWKVLIGLKEDKKVMDTAGLDLTDKEFCRACAEKALRILCGKSATLPGEPGADRKKKAALPKEEGAVTTPGKKPLDKKKEEKKAQVPKKRQGKENVQSTDKLSPESAMMLEQEIRFFLENGQKKADIIPELMRSYRVSEETVKELIAQYEELSGKAEDKPADGK